MRPYEIGERIGPWCIPREKKMIAALETKYRGIRFRSRLEARWAVFFDVLGLSWEYEPEGFSTSQGNYRPDFLVDEIGWIEVKPELPSDDATIQKLVDVGVHTKKNAYFVNGFKSRKWHDDEHEALRVTFDNRDGSFCKGWDDFHLFCECPCCGKIGLQFEGRDERIHGDPWGKRSRVVSARIHRALDAARGAVVDRSGIVHHDYRSLKNG